MDKTGKLCCFNSKSNPVVRSCQPKVDNHYRVPMFKFDEILAEKLNFL